MGSPPPRRTLGRHLGPAPLGPFRPKNRMAAYVGQKYLLQWIAEPLDRPGKRPPFNGDDILHHLIARLSLGPHVPEPVPIENQSRTYWWCSPPRIGRQRICPARSTVRENGASSPRRDVCGRHYNISCTTAGGGGGDIRRTRQRGRGIPVGSNRSVVRHTRFAMETVETSADRECPLIELVG